MPSLILCYVQTNSVHVQVYVPFIQTIKIQCIVMLYWYCVLTELRRLGFLSVNPTVAWVLTMDVLLSFRKITSGVFYVIHSKQPCLVPTRAGLFQSFLSLELGSQQQVTHFPSVCARSFPSPGINARWKDPKNLVWCSLDLFCVSSFCVFGENQKWDLNFSVAVPTLWSLRPGSVKPAVE